jgi:hypothetical protein
MMAQSTSRDSARSETAKAAELAQDSVERTGDAVADGIAATTEAVQSGTRRMLDAAEELVGKSANPMMRLVLDRTGPAMQDMVKAENDLASFWLEMSRDHAQHTLETMQRLAAARTWREAMELQSDYLRESMARLAEGATRQLALTRALTTSLLDAGRGNLKDAA